MPESNRSIAGGQFAFYTPAAVVAHRAAIVVIDNFFSNGMY
jgi:hypothetical protein